jgi:HNH endonuclease
MTLCWNWSGALDAHGYGQLGLRKVKTRKAHRYAYELVYGIDPGEMCVLHHCDNPACVNPAHLFLGTQSDNNKDASKKQRSARGASNAATKLSAEQVKKIRSAPGTQREIAARFGIAQSLVSQIRLNKIWKYV